MARLRIEDAGRSQARLVELGFERTTIGRGKANVVVLLDDGRTSLRHATIHRDEEGYRLVDEGSTNGTWVNCRRVDEHWLKDGDQIQIGSTLVFFVGDARV